MEESEWEKLFELIDKVIGLSMSASDRGELIRVKATEYGSEINLAEFCVVAGDE
jgi:hypothetical protein